MIALLFILKQKIFMKILKMMLKKYLTHRFVDRLLPIEKNKKVIALMKDGSGGKIMIERLQ